MILKVVLVLSQRTSLYAHPYDWLSSSGQCASAAQHGNLKLSHTPRGTGARKDPDVPFFLMERRASCSVYQPERNRCERGVLKSSAESNVDDGQVEQEDNAPEEEAAADPEERLHRTSQR